jgi:RNA polymerase sigma-70 factor, ECF subfamily
LGSDAEAAIRLQQRGQAAIASGLPSACFDRGDRLIPWVPSAATSSYTLINRASRRRWCGIGRLLSGFPGLVTTAAEPGDIGDRFTRLVLPEVDVLLRVAHTIVGRPADAEDLVQDTLLRAYRSIETFDGAHPRAWLLTIMRNAHVNQHRRRRPVLLRERDLTIERSAPPADDVVERVLHEHIEEALRELSPRHRRVVDLVDIGGLSYAEAALALDVPVGTIMSRLHRARRQLRRHLRNDPRATAAGTSR